MSSATPIDKGPSAKALTDALEQIKKDDPTARLTAKVAYMIYASYYAPRNWLDVAFTHWVKEQLSQEANVENELEVIAVRVIEDRKDNDTIDHIADLIFQSFIHSYVVKARQESLLRQLAVQVFPLSSESPIITKIVSTTLQHKEEIESHISANICLKSITIGRKIANILKRRMPDKTPQNYMRDPSVE